MGGGSGGSGGQAEVGDQVEGQMGVGNQVEGQVGDRGSGSGRGMLKMKSVGDEAVDVMDFNEDFSEDCGGGVLGKGLLRSVRGLLRKVWVGMEEWRKELFWGQQTINVKIDNIQRQLNDYVIPINNDIHAARTS